MLLPVMLLGAILAVLLGIWRSVDKASSNDDHSLSIDDYCRLSESERRKIDRQDIWMYVKGFFGIVSLVVGAVWICLIIF